MNNHSQWDQMEDAEDEGLKAIMKDRFQRPGEWEIRKAPEKKHRGTRKGLGGLALWSLVAVVFTYWLVTGQMTVSAALPCLMVCAGLGGYRLGRDLSTGQEG